MDRILVVDDMQPNINILYYSLTAKGHEVITALSGEACLQQALEKKPDLILLDIHMPGLDGIETCVRMRADKKLKDIPIIMASADDEDEIIIKALNSGANDYVTKPFKLKILNARIDAALRLRRSIIIQQRLADQLVHSEKMATVGQLASGIAHEINNPMSFIISNLNTLEKYIKTIFKALTKYNDLTHHLLRTNNKLLEENKDTFDIINSMDLGFLSEDCAELIHECLAGGDRIKHIVQDMAHLHNIDKPDPEPVDIHRLLEEVAQTTTPQRKGRIKVIQNLGELPTIVCVRHKLYEVFLDIFLNAIQAINGEGLITLSTKQDQNGIYCNVEDDGIGIEPQHLKRIFDPFFTSHDIGQGIGLGLFKCYRIVKSMGGGLSVISTPGEGATFTVFLPYEHSDLTQT